VTPHWITFSGNTDLNRRRSWIVQFLISSSALEPISILPSRFTATLQARQLSRRSQLNSVPIAVSISSFCWKRQSNSSSFSFFAAIHINLYPHLATLCETARIFLKSRVLRRKCLPVLRLSCECIGESVLSQFIDQSLKITAVFFFCLG
jgi:hypothetical protein